MRKPDSLRSAITAVLPEIEREPGLLHMFIEKGAIAARGTASLSFEYRYTLTVVLLDFAGDEDLVMLAIMYWLQRNQADLLQNHDKANRALAFQADMLDLQKVDLSLELELTEAVIVRPKEGGGWTMAHAPEPEIEAFADPQPAGLGEVYQDGVLVLPAEAP